LAILINPASSARELNGTDNRKGNGNPKRYRSLFKGNRNPAQGP